MADEIEKLREKIEKDPNSKLFVSLADMYRRSGQLEQAIEVLKQGIERQPNYTSARVSLAKIYIEKEMKKEAKEEFEIVVKAIPDNLYSQKKLAEIYLEEGDREAAKQALMAVVKLNPMDEESPSMLARVEKEIAEAARIAALEAEKAAAENPKTEEAAAEEKTAPEAEKEMSEESVVGGLSFDRESANPAADEDWLKNTFDMNPGTDEAEPAQEKKDVTVSNENTEKQPETAPIEENEPAAPAGVTEADFILSPAEAEQPEIIHESEIPGRIVSEEAKPVKAAPSQAPPVDDSSLYAVAEMPEDFAPQPLKPAPKKAPDPGALERADSYVKKGKYAEAFSILSNILSCSPDDKIAKERFQELRMLIKLLKKEKEVRAGRLASFLGAVRKRKDEFFGNA